MHIKTGRRPSCAWCRGGIGWNTRQDAKFCSRKCRQADYRFRAKFGNAPARTVPAVRDRTPIDTENFDFPELPLLYADRPVYWVVCTVPAVCRRCRAEIGSGADAMIFGPGIYFLNELGPFCNGDCALDFVYARPVA